MTSTVGSTAPLRTTDNEALIESSFRRLLSSIDSEREKIRGTWSSIDSERDGTKAKLEVMRQETQEWCVTERQKIEEEWKRLDKLRDRMSVIYQDGAAEVLEINCSGTIFSFPKAHLVCIKESYLNHMFSDAFVQNLPRDADGRFFLDFNPYCFGLIVQYLNARQTSNNAMPPVVAPEQQQNMDLLADALQLKAFMPMNRINPSHGTSLKVGIVAEGVSAMEATYAGWQVISAAYPLSMASTAYFEVHVVSNDEARGGLAIGVCGHIPQGTEIHTIRLSDCVLYNSAIGLIGDAFAAENVTKGIVLSEGSIIGVKHDVSAHKLEWFYNRSSIGSCTIKQQSQERLMQIFPVVALGAKGQQAQFNFTSRSPYAKGEAIPTGEDPDM